MATNTNTNTSIEFGKTVSLQQAATLIATNPRVRFLLRGEPGIGKSSTLSMIIKMLGGTHEGIYRDMSAMAEGEAGIPMPNHETRTSSIYPNAAFGLHSGKPKVICLDEFSKGTQYLQNMFHPMLERTKPRFGDMYLPEDTIVYLTGNLVTDGVGDTLKAHTRDRVVEINVRKPSSDEWLGWALNNGINPALMAWVNEFPHALASYLDGDQSANPYIFNPRKVQSGFVTPRSLDIASDIINTRDRNATEATTCALESKLGRAAALDMQAFIDYQDQLPKWQEIIDDPKGTRKPTSSGACSVLVFGAVTKIEKATMTPFMTYLERLEPEWQAAFAISVAKNPDKQSVAFSSSAFAKWLEKNEDLL